MSAVLGSMRRLDDGRGAVRMEDVYDTGIGDLWSAVTEPERLARWIAEVEGDPRVGGTVRVRFTSSWDGPARIDVCDAPHHLVVTLNAGTDDEAVIEATLSPEGDRTRLVVEERGLPLDVLHLHGAGWQAHVEDLAGYLAGGTSTWRARWEELAASYPPMRPALFSGPESRQALVRSYFRAYEENDRAALAALLHRDFAFRSPFDDDIDTAAYFARCWPRHEEIEQFTLLDLVADDDHAFVRYHARERDESTFDNVEEFAFDGDLVAHISVFFGALPG